MRFIVVAEALGCNKLPTKIETAMMRQARPCQAGMFQQINEAELNRLENTVAACLDKSMRFEIVAEDEWEHKLNALLA